MTIVVSALAAAWAFAGTLAYGVVLCPVFLVLLCVPKPRRYLIASRFLQSWGKLITRGLLFCRPAVEGLEHAQGSGGALVVSNHRSWLDPILMFDLAGAYGISKKAIFYIPIVGQLAAIGGVIFFDRRKTRERAGVVPTSIQRMKDGLVLSLYPEGTRSRDGRLRKRVYLRLIQACHSEDIPVVPCALMGTENVIPVGRFQVGLFQRPQVCFKPALYPRDFENSKAFALACWAEVEETVVALGGERAEA